MRISFFATGLMALLSQDALVNSLQLAAPAPVASAADSEALPPTSQPSSSEWVTEGSGGWETMTESGGWEESSTTEESTSYETDYSTEYETEEVVEEVDTTSSSVEESSSSSS